MVLPQTAEDVSLTVRTLVAGDCPFGIRGGGHSSHPLSNSVEDGITIDFGMSKLFPSLAQPSNGRSLDDVSPSGHMNATTWDPDTGLVSIQPGGRWQDVYDTLMPHGITVAGGRVGSVGIGGFLSGGGISFFAASHGWACDTVANYEVVLADGTIAQANFRDNPDLWRALKGASANLGLVTRFDMRSIELPGPSHQDIWGGNLVFGAQAANSLIDSLVEFTDNVRNDENSSVSVTFSYQPELAEGMVSLVSMENTLALAKPPAFEGFYGIEGALNDTTRVATVSALARELSEGQPVGFR
jgi:FAD/FMN-containing dehydrogenase